jgi:hypothetical protein
VRVLDCGGIDALVSTLARAPVKSSLDDIRAHDHALQSAVHHGATAAATRFGQTFADDEETRRTVKQGSARIVRLLEEYDGCVEMRLLLPAFGAMDWGRVVEAPTAAATGAPAKAGPGREYLEGLRREQPPRVGLMSALGPVVRDERVMELPQGRGAAFAHLIRRQDERKYREAISALPALSEAKVVGPLAFYSFAEPSE